MTLQIPMAPRATRPGRTHDTLKRVIDLVLALLLFLIAAPVMLLLAVGVRLTSRGPALYRQTRIGRFGRPITVLKFRSMHRGADALVAALAPLNEASGPLFKIRRDPRLTPIGRWMRRFSLDELPQLFNVIGGSMSLVGPRPALPDEVARFEPAELRRHEVKPGLTGLAQVSGRSDLSWEEAVRLDLEYVAEKSVGLDLRILARTIPAVLRARGAY